MNENKQQWEKVNFLSGEMDKSTKIILREIIKQIIKDGTDVVALDYQRLQHCIENEKESCQPLGEQILTKFDRISRIKYMRETEQKYEISSLFNKVNMNKEQKTVSVTLNPATESYFNRLAVSHWTPDEVTEYITMPSEYAKNLFMLLRLSHENCCLITVTDLRRVLNVPESVGISDLEHEILEPAIEENKGIFPNLQFQEIHAPSRRVRRGASSRAVITASRPLTGFQFYWDPDETVDACNYSPDEAEGQNVDVYEEYTPETSESKCTSDDQQTIIHQAPPGFNPYITLVQSYIEENGKNGMCAFEHDQMTDYFGLDKDTMPRQAVKQILLDAIDGLKSQYESIKVSEAKTEVEDKLCTFYIIKYKELE